MSENRFEMLAVVRCEDLPNGAAAGKLRCSRCGAACWFSEHDAALIRRGVVPVCDPCLSQLPEQSVDRLQLPPGMGERDVEPELMRMLRGKLKGN